nr:hypothetical protein [Tanacetum cinerariifolium]
MISKLENKLSAHQDTISILSQQKDAQIKLYKTQEDKELEKVIDLENKVKVLDNIVYKTSQSIQTMNMLNNKCQMSFAKPEYLKKAKQVNPHLLSREYYYVDHMNEILGVYTELDEVTNLQCDYLELLQKCECLETELSKSKMMSKSFESVQKHVINLELELQQCKEKIKNGMSFKVNKSKDFCKERKQYFEIQYLKAQLQDKGIVISKLKKLIEKLKGKSVDTKFEKSSVIRQPNAFKSQRPSVLGKPTTFSNSFIRKDFSKSTSVTQNNVSNDFSKPVTAQTLPTNKKPCLKNTNVLAPGMYKLPTDHTHARTSKLPQDSKKTNKRFVNEIDRLSREYFYADHMNAILGVYTELDEVTNLQCNYLELLQKCECLETELSKSKQMSKSFKSVQKHAINLELELQQCKEKVKNDMSFKVNKSKDFCKEREQYFEIQDLKAQLQDKSIAISELKKLIEKLKGKSVDTKIEKSSVIRQPNASKSQKPSVLGKPSTFSNSFIRNDFSKSTSVTKNNVLNDFSKPVPAQTLPATTKPCLKNTNVLATGMYKIHTDLTPAKTPKLPQDSKRTNKTVSFSTGIVPTTSVSRPKLKSNPKGDRVLRSNSHGKKLEVEEHRRNVKLSKNKMPVTACTDNLNAKTVNVKSVSAMCAKSVMFTKHDLRVPKYIAKPLRKPVASESIKEPRNNEPDNSLSMGDERLDTIPTTESDEVIKSSVETLIPILSESEGILEHKCDVPSHDNSPPLDVSKDQIEDLSESNNKVSSIDDDSFSIDNIDYIRSDSTTTLSDISLPEYEVFHDDHVKEISSGIPTTHSDSPFYASFIFDLSINPFPPADRSDFYEFTDELIPFISPPEYDCFLFKVEPNSGDFTKDVVEDISPTKEPQVHNALPTHPTFQLNMKF